MRSKAPHNRLYKMCLRNVWNTKNQKHVSWKSVMLFATPRHVSSGNRDMYRTGITSVVEPEDMDNIASMSLDICCETPVNSVTRPVYQRNDGFRVENGVATPCLAGCKQCDATHVPANDGSRLGCYHTIDDYSTNQLCERCELCPGPEYVIAATACPAGCNQCNATNAWFGITVTPTTATTSASKQRIYRIDISGAIIACPDNCLACNQHGCTKAAYGYGLFNYTCNVCNDTLDFTMLSATHSACC